ncbi:MAG: cation:proton antiporter [Prevotellaceae bacterium]|jgi:Kef-type K+ transport system membrane component KefB|nr:cation:proton antiporter [Prevotellaceae bacterium]
MDWLLPDIHFPITDPTWIFLLVLMIILCAPLLLNRLRIPHIIGLLFAGIIVGEHGFNILARDSSFELFGRVGIYYIMFLAGLEMDLENFKKNRLNVLIFGILTFSIPALIGLWSSTALLHYGIPASALLVCIYGSHTLVSYPIIGRYGLARERSVSIAVGATALVVSFALFILALVSSSFNSEAGWLFWIWMGVKLAVVLFVIIYLFPRVARWFFRNYEDNILQFILVLVLVFLGGALLEVAGVDGLLGAFLVGLMLNKLVPNVSPLMNRLEFVGNALFIPYFLIGVGMLIDVRAFVSTGGSETLKVATVMTVVAIGGKWLAAFVAQKTLRLRPSEGGLIFGLSNAHAAATLAVVMVGNRLEVAPGVPLLNNDVFNGSIVMILFSCVVSSLATEHAARKIAVAKRAGKLQKEIKEVENILIPVANPATIDALINMALLMKKQKRKEGLIALSIVDDSAASGVSPGNEALEKAVKVAAAADVRLDTRRRFDLNIASGIIHTAKEVNASEVIIGLHWKANLVDTFFGSLAENLLAGMHKQVIIVRNMIPANTLKRIIVAVPPKAEYEAGFYKWVKRITRMGLQLGCRVCYFAHPDTIIQLNHFIHGRYRNARTEFAELSAWNDLPILCDYVHYDDLLVIVSARRRFISYDSSFDNLPTQITNYFNHCSFMVIYPDQYGDPQDIPTLWQPLHQSIHYDYERIGRKMARLIKKDKTHDNK